MLQSFIDRKALLWLR